MIASVLSWSDASCLRTTKHSSLHGAAVETRAPALSSFTPGHGMAQLALLALRDIRFLAEPWKIRI